VSILDYINEVNNTKPPDIEKIRGYVKIENNVYAIMNINWDYSPEKNVYTYCDYDDSKLPDIYVNYMNEDEVYTNRCYVHINSTEKICGKVYGLPDEGIIFCYSK
jgi:hypothetical protein